MKKKMNHRITKFKRNSTRNNISCKNETQILRNTYIIKALACFYIMCIGFQKFVSYEDQNIMPQYCFSLLVVEHCALTEVLPKLR